jgi:hypothetical protein
MLLLSKCLLLLLFISLSTQSGNFSIRSGTKPFSGFVCSSSLVLLDNFFHVPVWCHVHGYKGYVQKHVLRCHVYSFSLRNFWRLRNKFCQCGFHSIAYGCVSDVHVAIEVTCDVLLSGGKQSLMQPAVKCRVLTCHWFTSVHGWEKLETSQFNKPW